MLTLGELVVSEGTEIKEKDKNEGAGEGYCGFFGPGTELFTFTPHLRLPCLHHLWRTSEEIKLSYKTTVIMDKGGSHDCPAVAESGKSNQVPCFLYKCITEVHV